MKARAIADEIRSHRHDDVYRRHFRRPHCRKEQTNKCRGLIAALSKRRRIEATLGPKIRESKQFLELINEQQNSAGLGSLWNRSQCFGDAEARLGKNTLKAIGPSLEEFAGL